MARAVGLDLGDAFERVQQLVQVVGVPRRDEVVGVLGPRAARTGDPARIATGTASSLAVEAATPTRRTVTVPA